MLSVALGLTLLSGPAAALVPRYAERILGVGAVIAIGLAGWSLAESSASLPLVTVEGIGALVLVLTTGMGAVVVGYAGRNLRHEPYQRRFLVSASLLVTTASLVAIADNLAVLAVAWVLTSLLTVAVLRTGPPDGRQARSDRARRAFLVGDLALVGAVALLWADRAPVLAGLLVVTAAASRSGSGPFYRWLPASLGAPTPSSALLHAGVVNGGAVLLIKLSPEIGGLLAVAVAAALVGALTCVFAEAVMLTRPDVKGRLAWSTIAQMGFTMLLCGLGLPLAAGLHLVAHGFYKGTLFLGSGTSVRALTRSRRSPAPVGPNHRRVVVGVAYGAPAAAIVVGAVAAGGSFTAELVVPLLLAAVAGGVAARAALARTVRIVGAAGVVIATTALAGGYSAATVALKDALLPQLAEVEPVLSALWLIPVFGALLSVAATRQNHQGVHGLMARAWDGASRAGRPDPAFS